jgi:hypothetical protein
MSEKSFLPEQLQPTGHELTEAPRTHIAPEIGGVALAEAQESSSAAQLAFESSLDHLAAEVFEVAEKREGIERGGAELITAFGIKPELFSDQTKTLFFSAIADRYNTLRAHKATLDPETYQAEAGFVENATMMLALKQSAKYDQFKSRVSTSNEVAEDPLHEERVLDKYTNKQMTADLQKAIDEGLLDDVKDRMQIDASNPEDPYVLHVLNIAADDVPFFGMQPNTPQGDRDYNDPVIIEAIKDNESYAQYTAGLKQKGQEFQRELNMEDIPPAWVTRLNGRLHLNLPLPFAEKLAYPDEERNEKLYTEEHFERDRSILAHEFGHTQGGLLLDHSLYFGLMLEERRAELVGGDMQGYQEAKGFLGVDMNLIMGAKVQTLMEESPKGGEKDSFYSELSRRIGLQHTLELAMLVPHNYISERRPAQKAVNEYIGGLNGYLEKIYNADPDIQQKTQKKIEEWATDQSAEDAERSRTWLSMRERMYGLVFSSRLLSEGLSREEARHKNPSAAS